MHGLIGFLIGLIIHGGAKGKKKTHTYMMDCIAGIKQDFHSLTQMDGDAAEGAENERKGAEKPPTKKI